MFPTFKHTIISNPGHVALVKDTPSLICENYIYMNYK